MSEKYQIGITGATMNGDFGLITSYLGLYKYIELLGYKVTIIPPGKNKRWQESSVKLFNNLCDCQKKIAVNNYHKYQNIIDLFLLGPGELWDYTKYIGKDADITSHLNFLDDNTKRMSYGTSFREDYPTLLIAHPEKLEEYSTLLKKMCGLGVACDSDREILKDYYECNKSFCVIDPVFLPQRQYWFNLIKNKNYSKDNNIVLYPLNKISRRETVDNVSKALNIENIKIATGCIFDCQEMVDKSIVLDDVEYANPPEKPMHFTKWLEKIYNCKYLLCADYYSLCFAIIFKKNFVVFEEPEDKRIEYLVKKLGVEDRVVKNFDDEKIVELLNTPINYENVYEKLINYRKISITWLNKKIKEKLV